MTPFAQACAELQAAKVAEADATAKRIDAECAVLAFVETKPEGSATHRDGEWKAVVEYRVNRTVDQAAVASLLANDKFAWAAQRMFPAKFSLDTKEMRFFQSNEPEFYAALASAVTATPGKPGVRVELVGEQRRAA